MPRQVDPQVQVAIDRLEQESAIVRTNASSRTWSRVFPVGFLFAIGTMQQRHYDRTTCKTEHYSTPAEAYITSITREGKVRASIRWIDYVGKRRFTVVSGYACDVVDEVLRRLSTNSVAAVLDAERVGRANFIQALQLVHVNLMTELICSRRF